MTGVHISGPAAANCLPDYATASSAGFSVAADLPTEMLISVVLCTTGQHPNLSAAIMSVLSQVGASFELIVVDNRPQTGLAWEVVSEFVHDPRVRYVTEPVAGLSVARNTGIRQAKGQVIAFTDDDCIVDGAWASSICHLLDEYPSVACVTGRTVATGEMTTWERLFEEFGTFDRGEARLLWSHSGGSLIPGSGASTGQFAGPGLHSAIYPYTGVFGSGNNMAFRADAFASHGYFDEALGAGAPAGGGEDLDMFIRLILAGESLVFEPTALVRHQHRSSADALAAQISTYGSGLSAMITKHLLYDSGSWHRILRRVIPGIIHLVRPSSVKNANKGPGYPIQLTLAEWRGIAMGPWLYLRGRFVVRRRRRVLRRLVADAPAGTGWSR